MLAIARYNGISLTEAASRAGIAPQLVLRHASEGFVRVGDDIRAKRRDALARRMTLVTPQGPVAVITHDSRHASLIGIHHNAIRRYVEYGDTEALAGFEGFELKTRRGPPLQFATDPRDIDRLAEGGELAYDVYLRF